MYREVSMLNVLLLYLASFFLVFWGTAHLFPTKSVVTEFGDISLDNQRSGASVLIILGLYL